MTLDLKLLGISGSPRKGNSEYLLEKSWEGLENLQDELDLNIEKTKYSLRGKNFKPCIGCGYCGDNNGECVHDDDFMKLKCEWLESDVIIYSVPVYHMALPGQLKCFIDRLGNSLFGQFNSNFPEGENTLPKFLKIIGGIVQGSHIFAGQEHTLTEIINHALMMQSIPVTGDMWEAYIGAGSWTRNKMDKDALKELHEKEDFDTKVSIEAGQKLIQRALELAKIVKLGLKEERNYFSKLDHYKHLYKKRGESHG